MQRKIHDYEAIRRGGNFHFFRFSFIHQNNLLKIHFNIFFFFLEYVFVLFSLLFLFLFLFYFSLSWLFLHLYYSFFYFSVVVFVVGKTRCFLVKISQRTEQFSNWPLTFYRSKICLLSLNFTLFSGDSLCSPKTSVAAAQTAFSQL